MMRVRAMSRVRRLRAEQAGVTLALWGLAASTVLLAVQPAQAQPVTAPGLPGSSRVTSTLSTTQKRAIADTVKRCYAQDTQAKSFVAYHADLAVTVDASGEVRVANLARLPRARASTDLACRAFTERVLQAVRSPPCARVPVPANLLGQPAAVFTLRFRP